MAVPRFCVRHLGTSGRCCCGICRSIAGYLYVIIGIAIQWRPRKEDLTLRPLKCGAEAECLMGFFFFSLPSRKRLILGI